MEASKPIFNYRILKRLLVVAGVLALIVFGLHLWFVQNARRVLKQYISETSGGRFKLELSNIDLSLLTNRLQINNADLVSTDSSTAPITYHVSFTNISVKVGSLWSLLFQKK